MALVYATAKVILALTEGGPPDHPIQR